MFPPICIWSTCDCAKRTQTVGINHKERLGQKCKMSAEHVDRATGYDVTFSYHPGKRKHLVDTLSRAYILEVTDVSDDDDIWEIYSCYRKEDFLICRLLQKKSRPCKISV